MPSRSKTKPLYNGLADDPSVEVRDVEVRHGLDDVGDGVRVDPVVPVQHLLPRLPTLRYLGPGERKKERDEEIPFSIFDLVHVHLICLLQYR